MTEPINLDDEFMALALFMGKVAYEVERTAALVLLRDRLAEEHGEPVPDWMFEPSAPIREHGALVAVRNVAKGIRDQTPSRYLDALIRIYDADIKPYEEKYGPWRPVSPEAPKGPVAPVVQLHGRPRRPDGDDGAA